MNNDQTGGAAPSTGISGPILTFGFATAVAMWLLWLVTNLPGLDLPAIVTGPAFLVVLAAGCFWAGRYRQPAWIGGLGAGLVAGALDLLVLLSLVSGAGSAQPPDAGPAPGMAGLTPHAALWASGFVAMCALVGAGAGALGRLRPAPQKPRNWLARFGVVTCLATFPLLVLGGAVTSTDSGLSVPDWPGTYGANMFLYPIGLMTEHRIFLEHSHRLFGALIGLTTIVFAVQIFLARQRPALLGWGAGMIALVIVQGLLGGFRVTEMNAGLGVVHGVMAQIFLGLMAALTATLAGRPAACRLAPGLAIGLGAALLAQLSMGATYRHLSHTPDPSSGITHILWTHVAFSLVVAWLAMAAGARLRRSESVVCHRLGGGLITVVSLQLLLGVGALAVVLLWPAAPTPTSADVPTADPTPALAAAATLAQQANGALLLTLAAVALAWARPRPHKAEQSAS
ncbi:MAG: heme A synthase [Phycisphaerales bacterium JB039]